MAQPAEGSLSCPLALTHNPVLGSQEITNFDSNKGCVRSWRCFASFEKYNVKKFPECLEGRAPSLAMQGTRERKNASTSRQYLHNIWNSVATPPIIRYPFFSPFGFFLFFWEEKLKLKGAGTQI